MIKNSYQEITINSQKRVRVVAKIAALIASIFAPAGDFGSTAAVGG
jgi:hypothetical protein